MHKNMTNTVQKKIPHIHVVNIVVYVNYIHYLCSVVLINNQSNMETIYTIIKGIEYDAGDIEKGEFGGWVATAYSRGGGENYEACFACKRQAIAYVKKTFKAQFK